MSDPFNDRIDSLLRDGRITPEEAARLRSALESTGEPVTSSTPVTGSGATSMQTPRPPTPPTAPTPVAPRPAAPTTTSGGPVKRVIVSSVAGEIKVEGVSGLNQVRSRGGDGVEITQDGDSVRVTANRKLDNPTELGWLDTVFKAIGRVIPTDIKLEVPQQLDRLEVSAMAGNVNIRNVQGRLEVDSVAGNVDIRDATSFRIGSTAGNVDIHARVTAGENTIRTQAGNANIYLTRDSDADLEASVGAGDLHVKGFQITKADRRIAGGSLEGRLASGRGRLEVRVTAGNARVEVEGDSQ